MADAKTREQQEQEWWAAWWADDFSWAGLAPKPIGKIYSDTSHGGLNGEQSLQDYWRRDPATGAVRDDAAMQAAGELAECDGMVFHIAHLPPKVRAGAPTWKSDLKHENWERLEILLGPRLAAGAETKVNYSDNAEGPEGRAELSGCVLRGALSHPQDKACPLHLQAQRSATLGQADYSGALFAPGASFGNATFSGNAFFDSATFFGEASFGSATFSGNASFYSATFSGRANFENTTFSGEADFENATFSGYANFGSATFSGYANFGSATFSENARFNVATFSENASFYSATFSGEVLFISATFSGKASFDRATFSGKASFDRATFNGEAHFHLATFNGEASFYGATFSGDADFIEGKFRGKAAFRVKAFEEQAWFDRCLFNELVWFDGATFKGDMDFTAAVFDKLASFERISWPQDARHWHSAFDQATFRDNFALTGAGFRALAAFDGATLARGVQLDDPETEEAANDRFRAERQAAIESATLDGEDFEREENERRKEKDKDKACPVKKDEVRAHIRKQRDERLRQLERGCRVLKLAMEYSSNKTREQMLYSFELRARRKQRKLRYLEKTFSILYALASDYGASIWRPFAALAVLIAAFASIFWLFAAALDQLAGPWNEQLWAALDFSWGNVFKPLSALSEDAAAVKDGSMIDALLTQAGDGYAFGVKAIATLQSLLAIVLAFLFALAVRRRFQIS